MELTFELEVQSADAKAFDVDDLPEQPPPEPALDDDDGDDDDVDDYDMSTFIDDGDDEEDATDPPLNTSLSVSNGTIKEAPGVDDPPEQPPPEPIPDDEGGGNGAPLQDNGPGVFIDGGIDDEDTEDGAEERKNEESMKQQDFRCFNTSIGGSFKQNRHLSELEEYRSGANSNDAEKDGAAMHTDRRYLYQRALTRPVQGSTRAKLLWLFGLWECPCPSAGSRKPYARLGHGPHGTRGPGSSPAWREPSFHGQKHPDGTKP